MSSNEIISSGILELYVFGQTTEQETASVLMYKQKYPEVAAELLSIENAMEQYAKQHAIKPSDHIKENILSKIKKDNYTEPAIVVNFKSNKKGFNKWKLAAAAAIFLFLGSSITSILFYNKLKDANNQLTIAKNEIDNSQKNLDIILASNSQPINLKPLPDAPTSTAKIFWIKNTQEVYVETSGLPEAPSDMQYQLWAIIDGKPVDGGLILTSQNGNKYNIQKMKSFGKAEAFAITLEQKGGNLSPKGKMHVMSTT